MFLDIEFAAVCKLSPALTVRIVYPADLRRFHRQNRVLPDIRVGNRADNLFTSAGSRSDMLFFIQDLAVFFEEETVDPVVSCVMAVCRVDAAARDDLDIRALSDKEVVVHQVVDVAVGDARRNIYNLVLRVGFDVDIQTRLVLL